MWQISQIAESEGELEEEASGQNVGEVACAVGTTSDTFGGAQGLHGEHTLRSDVKRAQEVILFGNQQNRPAETTYFHNPDKRGYGLHRLHPVIFTIISSHRDMERASTERIGEVLYSADTVAPVFPVVVERDDDDDLLTTMAPSAYQEDEEEALSAGKSVAQYEKGYKYGVGKEALDKHVENALLKSELYGEPSSVNQYRYYGGGDDQRGREEGLFAAPNKRSGSSSFRPMVPHALPATQQGVARLKRDLELDPEDVLALLSLWEAQHHNNYPYRSLYSDINTNSTLTYWGCFFSRQPRDTLELITSSRTDRAPATNWPQYNGYESPDDFDTPEDDGNTEDEEESPNGKPWLITDPIRVRAISREGFMAGGVHSLAQLLNSVPRRDPGVPEVYPALACKECGKHLGKTTLGRPDRDSNLNTPVIGSLVYCESSLLDHVANERALYSMSWETAGSGIKLERSWTMNTK
uniref:Uncharacterized protein n=1 Tax=Timema bartmani TaxID=61472 RepID=A0A7R9EU36_9NEOP|nr:unnamed protein product [Timema bartmani]